MFRLLETIFSLKMAETIFGLKMASKSRNMSL